MEYGPDDYSKIYDAMVEVIDVANNRLLVSERVGSGAKEIGREWPAFKLHD